MIIIDFSQLCVSNLMVHAKNNEVLNEDEFRIMVMNGIRKNVAAFKNEFGRDIVIACDPIGPSWRAQWFPYYKANRKTMKDNSIVDWNVAYEYFNKIKDEIRENTNYKVIQVPKPEADDIIAYFATRNGVELGNNNPTVIISGDKDFIQLQKYTNVHQYDPIHKKKISYANPELYLIEHIIKGDRGDGIPNCLSADDVFMTGTRQTTMTKGRYEEILKSYNNGTIDIPGFFRNKTLIDLTNTPKSIQDEIQAEYDKEAEKPKKSMLTYLSKYKMTNLIEHLNDF